MEIKREGELNMYKPSSATMAGRDIITSIPNLEKAIDPDYITCCTDEELKELISISNEIFRLANQTLRMRGE